MKEAYCSQEIAKLLEEKGFPKGDFTHYEYDPKAITAYKTCTHQMAMKWLREVHNKHCDIGYDIDLYWFFQIIELKELIEHFDYSELKYYHTENETGFNTYEEAVEASLKYTLKYLIKS